MLRPHLSPKWIRFMLVWCAFKCEQIVGGQRNQAAHAAHEMPTCKPLQ